MCIQKEKKKFPGLEEAQDTPTAQLCEGILQTLRGYFGQISSFLSLEFKVEGGMGQKHSQEVTGEVAHPPYSQYWDVQSSSI